MPENTQFCEWQHHPKSGIVHHCIEILRITFTIFHHLAQLYNEILSNNICGRMCAMHARPANFHFGAAVVFVVVEDEKLLIGSGDMDDDDDDDGTE